MTATRLWHPVLVVTLAAAFPLMSSRLDASAIEEPPPKKVTREVVVAYRDRIRKAAELSRELAARPPPKGLTGPQLKTYQDETKKLKKVADDCDALAAKVTKALSDPKVELTKLHAETALAATQLQQRVTDLTQAISTITSLSKQFHETASSVIANLRG